MKIKMVVIISLFVLAWHDHSTFAQQIKIVPSSDTLTAVGSCTPCGFTCKLIYVDPFHDWLMLLPYQGTFCLGPPPCSPSKFIDSVRFEIVDSAGLNTYDLWYDNYSRYSPIHMIIPFDSTVFATGGAFDLTVIVRRNGTPIDSARQHFISHQTGLGVSENTNSIPKSLSLLQNYPNPFNPTTTIEYRIIQREHVLIRIYTALGELIATLVDEYKNPGDYFVYFDAANIASGVYFCRMQVGIFSQTRKLTLLR